MVGGSNDDALVTEQVREGGGIIQTNINEVNKEFVSVGESESRVKTATLCDDQNTIDIVNEKRLG